MNDTKKEYVKNLGNECEDGTLSGYSNFDSLRVISFTPNIRKIKEGELSDCSNLEKVYIPETVEEIEENCFSNNPNLKEVHILGAAPKLNRGCFCNNPQLRVVKFEDNSLLMSLNQGVFAGSPWLNESGDFIIHDGRLVKYQGEDGVVCIPEEVRIIASHAFSYIKKLYFAENSKCYLIEAGAFHGCLGLREIVLPKSMRIIEGDAFGACPSLKKIIINDEIESIDKNAFFNCKYIKEAVYPKRFDENKSGIADFIPPSSYLYETRQRLMAILEVATTNDKCMKLYELAALEAIKSGKVKEESEVLDYICSYELSRGDSPENKPTFMWWKMPKENYYCACLFVCGEMRMQDILRSGVAFQVEQDENLPKEAVEPLKLLSEACKYQVCVFKYVDEKNIDPSTGCKYSFDRYIDLLTGCEYAVAEEYAGYSHDGSETYYNCQLVRLKK